MSGESTNPTKEAGSQECAVTAHKFTAIGYTTLEIGLGQAHPRRPALRDETEVRT